MGCCFSALQVSFITGVTQWHVGNSRKFGFFQVITFCISILYFLIYSENALKDFFFFVCAWKVAKMEAKLMRLIYQKPL